MSTIRPILSSGVRLGTVPTDNPSHVGTGYEEVPENVDSIELEGSCELMYSLESDPGNYDDEMKRSHEEQRHKRILKRWSDYFDAVDMNDNN